MALTDVNSWIEEYSNKKSIWFVKRLAANDTLATDAHQAGPYIPKGFLFHIYPTLYRPNSRNPDVEFDLYIDSHADHRLARAVWYNNRLHGGTRNECRITRLGGSSSALLDPDSTGALAVFVFVLGEVNHISKCHVWVCDSETEADVFEEILGSVEPKQDVIWEPQSESPHTRTFGRQTTLASCALSRGDMPSDWLLRFPKGEVLIQRTIEMRPATGLVPDVRILKRRSCEFEMYQSVEEAFYSPKIKVGFANIHAFLSEAQSILQRRKSRSGNSFELHTRAILREEGLKDDVDFSFRPTIEGGKQPDFLFPSVHAYNDRLFPDGNLRMLGVKTSCRDRWRQVLNEASRIRTKHLFTLQEGVSVRQFSEMTEANVKLVVPKGLHQSFPNEVKPHLITFESFIGDLSLLQT